MMAQGFVGEGERRRKKRGEGGRAIAVLFGFHELRSSPGRSGERAVVLCIDNGPPLLPKCTESSDIIPNIKRKSSDFCSENHFSLSFIF